MFFIYMFSNNNFTQNLQNYGGLLVVVLGSWWWCSDGVHGGLLVVAVVGSWWCSAHGGGRMVAIWCVVEVMRDEMG